MEKAISAFKEKNVSFSDFEGNLYIDKIPVDVILSIKIKLGFPLCCSTKMEFAKDARGDGVGGFLYAKSQGSCGCS